MLSLQFGQFWFYRDWIPCNPDYYITYLYLEARRRWLEPIEVMYILQNHEHYQITQETPQQPPSGSLFLFDRIVVRYFRKDGYNWQKKRDGRTVREARELLKLQLGMLRPYIVIVHKESRTPLFRGGAIGYWIRLMSILFWHTTEKQVSYKKHVVFFISDGETRALCAVKELKDIHKLANIESIQKEIKILSQLEHPNIVKYYGYEIVGSHISLYMEYIHPGSLKKYILEQAGRICWQSLHVGYSILCSPRGF